jgi:hypothetical protein
MRPPSTNHPAEAISSEWLRHIRTIGGPSSSLLRIKKPYFPFGSV